MTADGGTDQLDGELLDCMAELIGALVGRAEGIAQRLGVPGVFLKALHRLDCPMAMKDLGQRMHCDPSFVTSIADMLEKRGLAVREPDPADRRVKRLVLTSAGLDMKHQMEQAMLARMPWRQSLTVDERAALISLLHKMTPPMSDLDTDCPGEEVTSLLATATAPQVS